MGVDDRLRRDLPRLARASAPPTVESIGKRKRHRRTLRRLETAAIAVVVLAGSTVGGVALLRSLDFRQAAGSPGGGRIVFSRPDGNRTHLVMSFADGTGQLAITSGPYVDSQPAWSPDGTRIVFVRERCCTPGPVPRSVWVISADGGGIRQLTKGPSDVEPSWSPTGSEIVYASVGGSDLGIRAIRPDGSGFRRVTDTGFVDQSPGWSADGSTIAFVRAVPSSSRASFPPELWVVKADGNDAHQLAKSATPSAPYTVSWSPAGRIAFDATVTTVAPCPAPVPGSQGPSACRPVAQRVVMVARPDGSSHWLFSPDDPVPGSPGTFRWPGSDRYAARFSPDGAWIAYVRSRHVRGATLGPADLYVARSDGTQERRIAMNVGSTSSTAISWSPDSEQVAFSGDHGIHIVDRDGEHLRMLDARGIQPAWGQHAATPAPLPPSPTTRPSPHPSPTPSTSSECAASETRVRGDFNGDGTTDVATIGSAPCVPLSDLVHPAPTDFPWYVWIDYPGAGGGAWAMPECDADVCKTYGAFDLNGDGTDELGVVVSEGASTRFIEFFEATLGPDGPLALAVAPPGSTEFPAGEPARFPTGGSVTHSSRLDRSCGGNSLISGTATLSKDQTTWTLRRTTLGVPGPGQPLDPFFTVVGTGTFTVPVDSPMPDICLAPLNP